MQHFIKHLLLVALLISHVSWGSMMPIQMQTSKMTMASPELSVSQNTIPELASIANIDSTAENPCPNHDKTMSAAIVEDSQSMSHANCNNHDCSNCNCVNVLSSLIFIALSLDQIPHGISHDSAYLTSVFPESPLDFILRPPIS